MALNENSQPRKPSGPECDSSRYTTRPTTTEGKASDVLSSVRTMPRPRKRATASQAQPNMPTLQASRDEQALTASERVMMDRSEEHTSELTALMRISYAVFCWKKKR